LNRLYRQAPALHQQDFSGDGFEWVDHNDAQRSVFSFIRKGADTNAAGGLLLVVCNMAPVVHHGFRLGVPRAGTWAEKLNTDSAYYAGSNVGTPLGVASTQGVPSHGREQSLVLTLPPLATIFFEWTA